jgi:hypothetical protein
MKERQSMSAYAPPAAVHLEAERGTSKYLTDRHEPYPVKPSHFLALWHSLAQ